MYQYQDQKEMRRALNGKMIIMLVGIMLVVTVQRNWDTVCVKVR